MSTSSETAALYKSVVEDVIQKVRVDFVNMGVDEQVLIDLQSLWEQKLVESGSLGGAEYPVLGRDYGASAGFYFYNPTGGPPDGDNNAGGPMMVDPRQIGSSNAAYPLHFVPSSYYPGPGMSSVFGTPGTGTGTGTGGASAAPRPPPSSQHLQSKPSSIGQFDGAADAGNPNHSADGDELGSSLDDDSETSVDLLSSTSPTENILLCQYEKVARTKNKYRCTFRLGILHVGGREYAFHKATADYQW